MSGSELRAMLITAGFGTRLAPMTDRLPKPAVPVANRPAAWFALDALRRAGVQDFVLNTHHLAAELERELRAVAPPDVQLRFVHEPTILGTAGGVHNAWQPTGHAHETFVVMNGKLVFEPNLAAALALHHETDAYATMIVQEVPASDPIGVIRVDDAGRVRGMPGHPAADSGGLRHYMYTGVSLLSAAVHRALPQAGCLIRDGYARWLAQGKRVLAYVDSGHFRDVGMSPWHYLEANLELASGRVRWPGIDPNANGVLLATTARVPADAVLRNCVVGADTQLAAGIELDRCVIWPGARVDRSYSNTVILPNHEAIAIHPNAKPAAQAMRV
ncbi:MAG: hypothetical protein RL701_5601 [Pseudomonadota bacterium]